VLAGTEAKRGISYRHYRAAKTFEQVLAWLRANGVKGFKPLHTLRKEAGSMICQQDGLFAASRFLRHADVAITAQHYAVKKERVTIGLGALLTPGTAENVVQFESQSTLNHEASQKSQKGKKRAAS